MKYQDHIKNLQNFVLIQDLIVLGTFGNLRKLVNFIKDDDFPSYWTLIRIKEEDYPIEYNNYSIFKVRHY